ncbi:MAG: hypothetical protein ACI8X5_002600 [Planctomycetota bacterium]|jgi:hypothetical protein
MSNKMIWKLGKLLEGLGLVIVLAGVLMSIDQGLKEEGLKSMGTEFKGLGIGGTLFMAGYLLERWGGRA